MMTSEPVVEERGSQPYVAVRGVVTMSTFATIAHRLPTVFGWLAARAIEPVGPPFFRYLEIDMAERVEVEAGVPVAVPTTGEGEIIAGVLPGGRHAVTTHIGPYDGLVTTTAELLSWAARRGVMWDVADTAHGQRWGSRLEVLWTDPREVPDPARWRTELAFRIADHQLQGHLPT
jgi:effector-binding domain-containing protein